MFAREHFGVIRHNISLRRTRGRLVWVRGRDCTCARTLIARLILSSPAPSDEVGPEIRHPLVPLGRLVVAHVGPLAYEHDPRGIRHGEAVGKLALLERQLQSRRHTEFFAE